MEGRNDDLSFDNRFFWVRSVITLRSLRPSLLHDMDTESKFILEDWFIRL
jgi:hypothetical protein